MHVKIDRDAVTAFCGLAKQITGGKTAYSFSKSVHIETKDGSVLLSASDLETWLRQTIPAEVLAPGKVMVSAELFGQLASLATREQIELSMIDGSNMLFRSGDDEYDVATQDPEEYPKWPVADGCPEISLQLVDLQGALARTSAFIAKEQGRYALNGVYMGVTNGGLDFVGTNGHKLAYCRRVGTTVGAVPDCILPASACSVIQKLPGSGACTVRVSENGAVVVSENIELQTRLVVGQFPDWRSVLPSGAFSPVTFDTPELRGALVRSRVMTSLETHGVVMTFSPGELTCRSRSPSGKAKVLAPAGYDGPVVESSFDPAYLLAIIDALDHEQVSLELRPRESVIIHGGHKDVEFYLCMALEA